MRVFAALFTFALFLHAADTTPPLYEPSVSPDHSEIAFISGGDIWTVPSTGGEARLLVSHPATESRPLYSPDGDRLAFVSTRTGAGDIYVLHIRTGQLTRITFDDARSNLDAWSPDGKYLYFSSNRGDIGNMSDLYKTPSAGGTALAISADRYADESQAAPNPVDGTLAFTSGGMAVTQWWRKGHAHIDETRFTLLTPAATASAAPKYQPFLENHAKNLWPLWSADGRRLFYVSDESGPSGIQVENLWEKPLSGNPRQLTRFTSGRVLFPSISADGKALVFERDFRIWKFDFATGEATRLEIGVRGTPAGVSTSHVSLTSGFRDLVLSPDGKKVAFIAHGEVFAASAKDLGNAARLTSTAANEGQLAWSPDSKRLAYISDREGPGHIYLYDLTKDTETALTSGPLQDSRPVWSPDGTRLAYFRDGREIHVLKPDSQSDVVLVTKKLRTLAPIFRDDGANPVSWSPDGEWLAYFSNEARGFSNVAVVPTAGAVAGAVGNKLPPEEKSLSYLSNGNGESIVWSPDRTYILFGTSQRTERRSIARVDLIPRTPRFREDQFRDLFRPETPARQDKSVQIVFKDIRRRLTLLNLGIDAFSQVISPDGKTLLFTAASGRGQENLYTYSLDELATNPNGDPAVPRQLTSTPGDKSNAQFSPDGKEVYYLENGRIDIIPVDNRFSRTLAITAEVDVNFDHEKIEVFQQVWTIVNETYYDAKFHGANWSDVRGQYLKWVQAARTPDEMRRVLSVMIGELNSSHSGISAGAGALRPQVTGRLGLTLDPADNTILSVTHLGPADVEGIKPGQKLLSVDGKTLTPSTSLDELLQYKVGKRVVVCTDSKKDIAILPVNNATEKRLLYREWVEDRRAYVNKISKGRLGYVHILDMSAEALDQLYLDLDSENQSREGVVIDIRNNNGGFVNSYALDVFTRRGYLTMTPRDRLSASARSMNGQRALELPTVLVVNQNSLSDAEDFTEGYRALKLGKVVGVPTAGWIIYTGSAQLIDGSNLRTPGVKITANDGTDMELHPRPVDVTVDRPVGESYSGHDAQLDSAVQQLLSDIHTESTKK
jgi:Tol biopolymer transport system component/C-terminal processing protease CtpA/Prc